LMRVKHYISLPLSILFVFIFSFNVSAVITGQCSDCHTMHNSQNGASMVDYTYGSETSDAQEYLLRGTCLGCHAQGGPVMIATVSGNDVPQVYHTDATGDLAGGNFAYILGTKGTGASDNKGHNVVDFGNVENTLSGPPGHHTPSTLGVNLTCAGIRGCHGVRHSQIGGIQGSHHKNVDGKLTVADEPSNSYRFLMGVQGLEDPDWQKTKSASDHNEYFGATTPMTYLGNCDICHHPPGIFPDNGTISGLCGTCHRDFHVTDGIGGDTLSPFTRHPTDVILPGGTTEYAAYNGAGNPYSFLAPVARTTVPDTPGSTVSPGTDAIMCLSCHSAHATDYDDMMRWDYRSATLSTAISGCSICHTSKD
jgi:hypothetical protein